MTGSMIGRVFNDRYKLTERIGLGGMAEVYRAQDMVLGRIVAVKVMLPQYAADPEFRGRFRQEAAAAANMQSPYIVNIYDWGQDGDTYYIVMEFVRGSDLKTGIMKRGAINQRKVAEIGAQVCQALSVAHNQDIIHRDIKPQNIMVQPDGNVKVMDFGIARAKNSTKTQTAAVLGTAHYISPEQAQGKDLAPTSDIYSLGVVLYEAATGQVPFDAPDAVSVAMKQVNEMPPLPSEINPNIDPDLELIICKAMEKDPAKRFATVGEMRSALNDFLAGRPISFIPTFDDNLNNGYSPEFSGADTQLLTGLGSADTAVLVGGAAGAGMAAGSTTVMPGNMKPGSTGAMGKKGGTGALTKKGTIGGSDSDDPEKKGMSKKTGMIIAAIVLVLLIAGGLFVAFGGGFGGNGSNDKGIAVPDVTGKSLKDATSVLEKNGFEVGTVEKAHSDKFEKDRVCGQDPAAGETREKGTKVNLTISIGQEKVTVPSLKNMTPEEAQAALAEAGLTAVAGNAEYSSKVKEGHVMKQDPASGTEVAKGSSVTYVLSLGAESSSVTNVVGWDSDEAQSTLEESGFKVQIIEEYSEDVDKGCVISQDPSSGTKLEKGGTVTLYVSKGPDPAQAEVPIPSVVGSTVGAASDALEAAGFNVSIAGDTDDDATVTGQSQKGKAKKGTTITITGKAKTPEPQPTPEPDDDDDKAKEADKSKN